MSQQLPAYNSVLMWVLIQEVGLVERDLNVAVLLAGIWRGQTVKTLFGAVKRCSPVQSTKIIQT